MPHEVQRSRSRVRWVLAQAALVAVAVFCYFQVRGLTQSDPATAVAHARDLLALEQRLGLAVEEQAQAPLAGRPWLQTAANWVYIWGHWPVIVATMLWLAWRHRDAFLRLRDAMLVSGALGLVVFVTYPVAPPRLVDGDLIDTVTASSRSYRVLQPPNFVNQYAAMPSLHAGWDLLVGLSILTAATWLAVRVAAGLLPLLMTSAVVVTANHYVLDVAAGIALALVGWVAAVALERARRRRREPVAGAGP